MGSKSAIVSLGCIRSRRAGATVALCQGGRYTAAMTRVRVYLLGLALCLPAFASAQWQWTDSTGRRVFSDQAPPPDIPASKIIQRPGTRAPAAPQATESAPPSAPAPVAGSPAASPPAAAAPAPTGRDKALEDRRKQAEAADTQKRQAEEERIAKLRAENCTRARQAKATLDSGMRLARVNDKGEREILDDAARAAEGKRVEEMIASECKPS